MNVLFPWLVTLLAAAPASPANGAYTLRQYMAIKRANGPHFSPAADPDEAIRKVARRRYGAQAAAGAVDAWARFSKAFELYPYSVAIYTIPTQHGPATWPPTQDRADNRHNPADYRPFLRGLHVSLRGLDLLSRRHSITSDCAIPATALNDASERRGARGSRALERTRSAGPSFRRPSS